MQQFLFRPLEAADNLCVLRRDWRNVDLEACGEQEDNDSITSRDRYAHRQVRTQTGTHTAETDIETDR